MAMSYCKVIKIIFFFVKVMGRRGWENVLRAIMQRETRMVNFHIGKCLGKQEEKKICSQNIWCKKTPQKNKTPLKEPHKYSRRFLKSASISWIHTPYCPWKSCHILFSSLLSSVWAVFETLIVRVWYSFVSFYHEAVVLLITIHSGVL